MSRISWSASYQLPGRCSVNTSAECFFDSDCSSQGGGTSRYLRCRISRTLPGSSVGKTEAERNGR